MQALLMFGGLIEFSEGCDDLLNLPLRPGKRIYLHALGRNRFRFSYERWFADDLILCKCPEQAFTLDSICDFADELSERVSTARTGRGSYRIT